jgi:hypothetical protein
VIDFGWWRFGRLARFHPHKQFWHDALAGNLADQLESA